MNDVIIRRDRLNPDEKRALRRITAFRDSERLDIGYDKCLRLAEIEDKETALRNRLSDLIDTSDVFETKEIKKELVALSKEKDALMGQSGEGLGVFKNMENLTANELTIRLLRKDEGSQPDRVELSARGKTRTVFCMDFRLIDKRNGLLNRAGQMLLAMKKKIIPEELKAPEQAMKELRKIFRGIGIMDKNPFMKAGAIWQPRFKLIDAVEQANKRAAGRALNVPYDDRINYDQETDAAGKWLQGNDK